MKPRLVIGSIVIGVVLCDVLGAQVLEPDFGISATFSIVAVEPETGTCGAAVASKYPAVGKVVPYVRAGVGAFCTQHWHNPSWGEQSLDLLELGHSSEEVLGLLLKNDDRRDKRQLSIIDIKGRAANRNPSDADPSGIYMSNWTIQRRARGRRRKSRSGIPATSGRCHQKLEDRRET